MNRDGDDMQVLMDLLGDVTRLLGGIDDLDQVREEYRPQVRALLESLRGESERVLSTRPDRNRREQLFNRALEAIAHSRLDEARSILTAAVQDFPDDAELHNHLGLVAWESGDFEASRRHYQAAVAVAFPDGDVDWYASSSRPFLRALEGQALAHYRLGELAQARDLFTSLADMNSAEFSGCRYLAGEASHFIGDAHAAIRAYELVPMEPAVAYNLGLAYFELGRREEAAQAFIAGFVGNRHITHQLTWRGDAPETAMPGFLASERYAEEFVQACGELWDRAVGAREFLARCYDHPLVQAHLLKCTEDLLEEVLSHGPEVLRENWYERLGGAREARPIVQQVLDVMDA